MPTRRYKRLKTLNLNPKPIYNHVNGTLDAEEKVLLLLHQYKSTFYQYKSTFYQYKSISTDTRLQIQIEPTPIIIFEGLHPFYDDRVNKLVLNLPAVLALLEQSTNTHATNLLL